jgi:hypothetical protein
MSERSDCTATRPRRMLRAPGATSGAMPTAGVGEPRRAKPWLPLLVGAIALTVLPLAACATEAGGNPASEHNRTGAVCGVMTGPALTVACARGRGLSAETVLSGASRASDPSADLRGLPAGVVGRWRSATGTDWFLQIWANGRYVLEAHQIVVDAGMLRVTDRGLTLSSLKTGQQDRYSWSSSPTPRRTLRLDGNGWVDVNATATSGSAGRIGPGQ